MTAGGHLGLFMGREALRDHWWAIFAGVYARSRRAERIQARRRARAATPAGGGAISTLLRPNRTAHSEPCLRDSRHTWVVLAGILLTC
jgi:hypothetical protein